jgi:hypothetical protein
MTPDACSLYKKYYAPASVERLELFTLLAERFACRSALYPGCFVHITPAFVLPHMCFVDMDSEAADFFGDPGLDPLVAQRKVYRQKSTIRFHSIDYERELPEAEESFDLLISLSAGFISRHCKRYLKVGGTLLVNNLHGDASMARLDVDYALVGAVNGRGGRFTLVEEDLAGYFVPKRDLTVNREYLERTRRGVAFTRKAYAYVFQRMT